MFPALTASSITLTLPVEDSHTLDIIASAWGWGGAGRGWWEEERENVQDSEQEELRQEDNALPNLPFDIDSDRSEINSNLSHGTRQKWPTILFNVLSERNLMCPLWVPSWGPFRWMKLLFFEFSVSKGLHLKTTVQKRSQQDWTVHVLYVIKLLLAAWGHPVYTKYSIFSSSLAMKEKIQFIYFLNYFA